MFRASQVMKWLEPLQCLATAGLDTTVNIFDSVLQSRAHELKGHSKGHVARDRQSCAPLGAF